MTSSRGVPASLFALYLHICISSLEFPVFNFQIVTNPRPPGRSCLSSSYHVKNHSMSFVIPEDNLGPEDGRHVLTAAHACFLQLPLPLLGRLPCTECHIKEEI